MIQTYEDAGHGNLASKVLDRKSISKTRPRMRDSRVFKNFMDMMMASIDSEDKPIEMDCHGPTIIYKNIFIY